MVRPGFASRLQYGLLAFVFLLVAHVSHAATGSVRLFWDPNSEANLAGYVLVWGVSSGVYTQSATLGPSAVTHEVTSLPDGTYYFAVRAFDAAGNYSQSSNEVRVVVSAPSISSPVVTNVTPDVGSVLGGTDVTIVGSGFAPAAAVQFGAATATVLQSSPTSITVRTPASGAGVVDVRVANPDGGTVVRVGGFSFRASTPSITSVTPGTGPVAGGTDVTIVGTGFAAGATVRFGAAAATVLQSSTSSITVRTPASSAGAADVRVTNPDGGTVVRAAGFNFQASAPSISSVSPTAGPTAGGTDVVITGANFQSGLIVRFGSAAATLVSVTPTRLAVRTPPQAKGKVALTVMNASGNGVSIANAFTYRGPTPSVTKVAPDHGDSTGGTTVTLDGVNFEAGVSVSVDTVPANVVSVSDTRLVVRMPAHAPAVAGLTVTNSEGQTTWIPSAFTYVTAAPTIAAVTPDRGGVEGGNSVLITGSGFAGGASVTLDGVAAAITALSDTAISVVAPPHASGAVSVVVRSHDGQTATAVRGYNYDAAAPVITGVAPASGRVEGGTVVIISGSKFGGAPRVTIAGATARVLTSTPTTITVETPPHAAGPVDVDVIAANGRETTAPRSFRYEEARDTATFVRYFAEGASGSFFQTRFAVANPHGEAMPLRVTFTDVQGTATTMELVVPASSRLTIDEANRPALASEAFATKFESPRVLGVERTVSWAAGGPVYGAHSDTGVEAPRTSWVLAEGATTPGFNTFYLLQNPTTAQAEVKVQYLLSTGQLIERIHPVAPLSRTNIWVNKDAPELAAAEMSATITSLNDVPVVVERSMYRNNGDELFSAGHNSAAVDAPALRWFLAEGATGGTFDEFVLIANPNASPANLRVSYLRAGKAPLVKTYTAGAQSRLTIWLDQEAPELAAAEVSIIVECLTATPVVVERSMWWRATPAGEWIEAHNSHGVTATAARWLVADSESGGAARASTFVLVANTAAVDTVVKFTLLSESGATRSILDTVVANGRYSLDVAAAFPEARDARCSVLVEAVSQSAALVVERSSYSSTPTTPWASGTNSVAMPLP